MVEGSGVEDWVMNYFSVGIYVILEGFWDVDVGYGIVELWDGLWHW